MAAPEFISNSLTIVEGQTITLSTDNIDVTASTSNPGEVLFEISPVVDAVTGESLLAGTFLVNGVEGTEFTQEDILNGLVKFRHDGTNRSPQYTVVASAGGESSEPNAPSVTFTAVNDGPIFSRNVLSISEGETVVLNSDPANLNLVTTDEESSPEALTYTIISVANGTFARVVGGTVSNLGVSDTFTQAEVNAGAIQFTHDDSETQPNYRLRVVDAGIPDDPTPKGSTRNVIITEFTPVNDAPVLAINTLTLTEGDVVVLNNQNLRATDVEDNNADLVYTITSVTGGRFELLDASGNVVSVLASAETAPIPFSQNDVNLQRVRFVNDPATDEPPAYTVEVSDLGDPVLTTSGEATVNFTPVNDLPVLETLALAIEEGETIPLSSDNLTVTDEETLPEDLQINVTSVTGGRFIFLADSTTAESFTQADINAGNIIAFEHNGSSNAPTFSLTVTDEGGESIIVDSGDAVVFGAFNDLPMVQKAQLTITEGGTVRLSSANNLLATDEESLSNQLVYTVEITNADPDKPDSFIINGTPQPGPVVTFTQAQVNAGQVQFVHGGSNFAPDLAITLMDTAVTPEDTPNEVPVDFAITFTATNDSPIFAQNTLTIEEGGTVVLNSDGANPNLLTTDEESTAEALTYTIDSVANGEFQLLGGAEPVSLAVGDTFTQAEVDAGLIQFVHDGGELAPDYSLTVTDGGINGDPATALSVSRELDIPEGGFITSNDAPVLETNALTLTEGDSIFLTEENLSATDAEDNDAALIFTVTAITNGRFERVTMTNGQEQVEVLAAPGEPSVGFTQDEVQMGLIRFVNEPGTNEPPTYSIEVSDLGEPPLTDSGEATITFTAVNDEPIFSQNTLSIEEGGVVVLNSDVNNPNLVTTDEETPAAELTYTIDSVANGEFQLLGGAEPVALAVGDTFTQADVDAGLIQFAHDGGELAPDYRLTVTDTGIDGDETTILSVSRDVEIPEGGFVLINDAPVLETNTLTLTEGDSVFLTLENLSATDAEDDDAALIFTVTAIANGRFERVTMVDGQEQVEVIASPDIAPISFTQADVQMGLIRFVNDPATDAAPTYSIEVSDLGDPPLTDSEAADIAFTAVNDVPAIAALSLEITEGEIVPLDATNLSVIDEETDAANLTYTVDSVTGGNFVLVADGSVVDSFTQADIDAGNIIAFAHDGLNDAPTFSLTASDGENPITLTSDEAVVFTPTNDEPVVNVSTLTITEDGSVVLSDVDNLSTTDEETPADQLLYTVTINNADPEQPDGFEIGGELFTGPEVTFTQAQVDAGAVTFVQGGSNFAPNLTVTVTDTFDPAFGEPITLPVDFEVLFTAINDTPEVVTNTLEISEGETVTLTTDNLLTTDEESSAEELTYTIDAVSGGAFQSFDPQLGMVTGTLAVGDTFTQADVEAGTIQFAHDGEEAPPSYTLTVTDTGTPDDPEPESVVTTVEIPEGGFTNVNDDPTLTANTLTISEGATVTFSATNLAATDPDSIRSRLQFEISDVIGGTFFLNGQELLPGQTFTTSAISFGQLTFVDDGEEGAPSYSVTVRDPQGGSTTESAVIEYTPVNDDPTIATNSFTIIEGGLLTLNDPATGTVNLLATDPETTLDANFLYTISDVTEGEFFDFEGNPVTEFTQEQLNNGDILFRHNGSEIPPTFNITVADGDGGEATAAAVVEFVPVNDPPTLEANQLTVTEGASLILTADNFSADDVDSPPEELTFLISNLEGGQFNLVGDATGGDISGSFTGSLTLTDEQVAAALADGLYINLHTQDFPNGELRGQINLEAADVPVNGVLEEAQEVDSVPDTAATGSFEATLSGNVLTISGSYSGLTSPLAPVGGVDAVGNPESAIHVHVGDAGTNGPILQNLLVDVANSGGTENVTSFTLAQILAGQVEFVDDGNQVPPSFDVSVSDGEFETEPEPVTITEFINVNDPPVAEDDGGQGFTTTQDEVLTTASVLENDSDVDPEDDFDVTQINGEDVAAGAIAIASGALVSYNSDGTFTYDPNGQFDALAQGESATDTFEYTISDLAGATATATVEVVVTGINDAPILEVNALTITEGGTVLLSDVNLLATDPDTDPSQLIFTPSDVTGGNFVASGGGEILTQFTQQDILDGLVTFVHDGGEDPPSYSISVSDGTTTTDPAAVTIEQFTNVNDVPDAVDDSGDGFSTDEDTPFSTGDVLANDVDPDGDPLTIVVPPEPITSAAGATVTLNPDGSSFTYDPTGLFDDLGDGESTTDTFSYTVTDGSGATDTATVTIEITGLNDAPTTVDDAGTVSERLSLDLDVLANDSDLDGDAFSLTGINGTDAVAGDLVSLASGSQVRLNQDGTLTYLPFGFTGLNDGQTGTDAFEYTVTDDLGNVSTGTVNLTITGFTAANNANILGLLAYDRTLVLDTPAGESADIPDDELAGLSVPQFFDEYYYLNQYSDVSVAVDAGLMGSGYQHFLEMGQFEGRNPSLLYNESFYLSQNSDVAAAVAAGDFDSGFEHFLLLGKQEGRAPSSRFSQTDYLVNNPDVQQAINTTGALSSAFEHYVEFGLDELRQPQLALYNEEFYLVNNPDVLAAVRAGDFDSGYDHFVQLGQTEGRAASAIFSENSYLLNNPDVGQAVAAGTLTSGFEHFVKYGRFEGRVV